MIMEIKFKTTYGAKYIMLFDSDYMTEKQARNEIQFMDFGMGDDVSLYPHYLIYSEKKKPIIDAIIKAAKDSVNKST